MVLLKKQTNPIKTIAAGVITNQQFIPSNKDISPLKKAKGNHEILLLQLL